jgi:hypothetical protein
MLTRRAALVFGIGDLLTAALVLFGVFAALPTRYAPVDVVAVGLSLLQIVSGVSLIAGASWSPRAASVGAIVALALGLSFITALALTASWLSGVYGAVGFGGAMILVLVAALALPYLVALPAVKLVWMWAPRKSP